MDILIGSFGEKITFLNAICRIILSLIIGGLIGFERESKNRPAGLKTHMLVCLASTLIAIIEQQLVYEVVTLGNLQVDISIGRLLVGVISGVGFIGTGTIMMSKSRVTGLTTAASLWCTACIGLANGVGYCLISLIAAVAVVIVLEVIRLREKKSINYVLELQYSYSEETTNKISDILDENKIRIEESSVAYSSEGGKKQCSCQYIVTLNNREDIKMITADLLNISDDITVKFNNII